MKVTVVETLGEFRNALGLSRDGVVLEADLDSVTSECDVNGRKRRDAEVLCTLAANVDADCLDLGTSHGHSAYRMATNLPADRTVFTVNLLPEQCDGSSGQLVTHLLSKDDIGSFYREHGVENITQFYENTASWNIPRDISGLGLVYIDAAHDTFRVHEDSRVTYDRVAPGCFVCWHDFSPDSRHRFEWIDSVMTGVEGAMAERCPDAEIVHLRHSWTGVLRKPAVASKPDAIRVGLILEKEFQAQNRWTSATTSALVNGILGRFDCRWIETQADYENVIEAVDILFSFEAGWGAPVLDLKRTAGLRDRLSCVPSYMLYSDPHAKKWREDYLLENFDYAVAFYDAPTRHHFRRLSVDRLLHFPWAIPDSWMSDSPIAYRGEKRVVVFGAQHHEAYSVRNWCRQFPFVESCTNSGCENKRMSESDYVEWLSARDGVVAAGSDSPEFRLTTPKYFEAAAAGTLLFAQETDDLRRLGFRHMRNCVTFNRDNFSTLVQQYLEAPEEYLEIRRTGRDLIRRRHTLSKRLASLEEHFAAHLQRSEPVERLPWVL